MMVLLGQKKAEELLCRYSIPLCSSAIAKSKEEAIALSKKAGFPVVIKIVSGQILHKSDAGGVIVGIKNAKELLSRYDEMTNRVKKFMPKAKIDGVLVQRMEKGKEVIVGVKKDPQFGHLIMFGLGGVFVEIMKDVSFRVAPVDKNSALEMIREVKGYAILKGYRGEKPVNI